MHPKPFSLEPLVKHNLSRNSTELGIQTDCNEHYRKQHCSIRRNLDPGSNVIVVNFKSLKHDLPRISTDRGTQMFVNELLQFGGINSSIFAGVSSGLPEQQCNIGRRTKKGMISLNVWSIRVGLEGDVKMQLLGYL
jgi:hypothetical protein